MIQNISDIHAQEEISDELKIKKHYEGLDIAQSNRIHYLQFQLPATELPISKDAILKEKLSEETIERWT